jgi:uncharacterized membrane protein
MTSAAEKKFAVLLASTVAVGGGAFAILVGGRFLHESGYDNVADWCKFISMILASVGFFVMPWLYLRFARHLG